MRELKPCPKCNKMPNIDTINVGIWWGCGIGCINMACDNSDTLSVIKYAKTKEKAEAKAAKAWNRRAE